MSAPAVADRLSGRERRILSRGGDVAGHRTSARLGVPAVSLETLSANWRGALDAGDRALRAASSQLSASQLLELGKRLKDERAVTARILEALAHAKGSNDPFVHLMVPRSQLKSLLGLPTEVAACLFDLDGLLIGSAAAHTVAWTETFDELFEAWPLRTGEAVAPFNPRTDYPLHMHGRPRLEGIRALLASRGIRLPEGEPTDAPGTETVHELANRKQQVLSHYLDEHGMSAFAWARRYLELVREAGVRSAVISASMNTKTMLNRAGLAGATDLILDGYAFVKWHTKPKPSPDSLLASCEWLGIEPRRAAAFETTDAGVTAARAAGVGLVIAIDRSARADALRAAVADLVIAELGDVLQRTRDGSVRTAGFGRRKTNQ